MEAKKEAKELIKRFQKAFGYVSENVFIYEAKKCALISIDDKIAMINEFPKNISCHITPHLEAVKQEIINYKE